METASQDIETFPSQSYPINFGDFHPQVNAPLQAVVLEQHMIVLNPSSTTAEEKLLAFDLDEMIWKRINLKGETPDIDIGTSICARGKNVALIFGSIASTQKEDLPKLYTLTFDSKNLTAKVEVREFERSFGSAFHTTQVFEDRLLLFGGETRSKYSSDDLFFINLDGDTSNTLSQYENPQDKPKNRVCAHSCLYGFTFFISGGYTMYNQSSSSSNWLCDLWSFDLRKPKWTSINLELAPFPIRPMADMKLADNSIVFFGGEQEKPSDSYFLFYDINFKSWKVKQGLPEWPPGAHLHAFDPYRGKLVIISDIVEGKDEDESLHLHLFSIPVTVISQGTKDLSNENLIKVTQSETASFFTALPQLLDQKLFSDIIFKVQDKEFPANKIILAARCPFFHKMFTSGMVESHNNTIEITDMTPQTFKCLLEYIYSNSVHLNVALALDLYRIADKYLLKDLKILCERFLISHINQSNLFELANEADALDAVNLRKNIVVFMKQNWKEINKEQAFNNLPKSIIVDLLELAQFK